MIPNLGSILNLELILPVFFTIYLFQEKVKKYGRKQASWAYYHVQGVRAVGGSSLSSPSLGSLGTEPGHG